MKQKTLAETNEFKDLIRKIKDANKDPAFRKGIQRFIQLSTGHG